MSSKTVFAVLLFAVIYTTTTEACSCFRSSSRQESLRNGVCYGDVYSATVTGAMCNCLPDTSQESYNVSCQDYRRQSSMTVSAELVGRAQCSSLRGYGLRMCSELPGNLTMQGYTVQDLMIPDNVTVENTTQSSGSCYLACPFNAPRDEGIPYEIQPCYYTVSVTEVFRGNYTVGQTLMVPGPDVLTSCGQEGRVLSINQQYVAGVGGACSDISEWSTLSSYTSNELQQLRSLVQQFEAGSLDCGAFGLLPSFYAVLAAAALITLCQSLLV